MYTAYLLTALVAFSSTLALPRPPFAVNKRDYQPISFTSSIPESVAVGDNITLSWTGGGGVYDLKSDHTPVGVPYAPVDLMISTSETSFEYTIVDAERIAFALFDVEEFASGEPGPGSWVNTGYIPIHA